jgi:S1-C subfamily serine protease
VDQAQAAAFGRPSGPDRGQPYPQSPPIRLAVPEITPPLADAFGRPADSTSDLQRPPVLPVPPESDPVGEPPWRDPLAPTRLGAPAETPDDTPPVDDAAAPAAPLPRYTLREALFARRLRPGAIIGLLLLCLVIGAGSATAGVLVARRLPAAATDPDFTLTQVSTAVDRPAGSVAQIAAAVLPSVVSIQVVTGQSGDTGSGFVIDGRGYILTNNHVISAAATDSSATITVIFDADPSTQVPATLVGRDPQSDLAVLKVDVAKLTVAKLGTSANVQVGDEVMAIGSPLGLTGTVTTGIISAEHRPVQLQGPESDTNAVVDALQTDASINAGNSGGPLIDSGGAVIGVNAAILTAQNGDNGSIGLGFAIPVDYAAKIATTLITGGKVEHATTGLSTKTATDGSTLGAQVQNVADGSPGAVAGIHEGDVITKVGDRAVASSADFTVAVQSHAVGETIPITLQRSGRTLTVQVTLVAG